MGPQIRAEPREDKPKSAVEALSALLSEDLAAVDSLIHERMTSPVGMIPELAGHLIDAGGKRVRPMVTLAVARAVADRATPAAFKLAAAVEFIHTATLLHDDVVDGSALRRGRTSANLVWGNSASVLVGDFLFARSFNLMVEAGDLETLAILARAASVIAEGEVMQLAAANDLDISIAGYLAIIEAKTAALFAAAARAGAVAAGADPALAATCEAYGRGIGVAFQLVDDALDYGGRTLTLGKEVGDDFREGKLTLPVLLAIAEADPEERAFWARTMAERRQEAGDFERAAGILRRCGALSRTLARAREAADAAKAGLEALPPGPHREALAGLADFIVERAH